MVSQLRHYRDGAHPSRALRAFQPGLGQDRVNELKTSHARIGFHGVNKARSTVVVDQHVGKRIRQFRTMLGLTQGQFGDLIGVTNQQVFKYEHGINGVSAGRLYEIARKLDAPPEYFFEGLDKSEYQLPPRQRRLLDVMRNIGEIKIDKRREAISRLVRALAGC